MTFKFFEGIIIEVLVEKAIGILNGEKSENSFEEISKNYASGMMVNKRLKELFSAIQIIAYEMWQRGWAEANAGNISLNVTAEIAPGKKKLNQYHFVKIDKKYSGLSGTSVLVTARGARMRDIAKSPQEHLLIIYISGKPLGFYIIWQPKKDLMPSSELHTHLSLQQFFIREKPSFKAVLHTHPTALISLSHLKRYNSERRFNRLLFNIHPEIKLYIPEGIGLVSDKLPGSEELAESSTKLLRKHRIVLWQKHGCVSVGPDIQSAFDLIDMVNKAACIFFYVTGRQADYWSPLSSKQ